LLNDSERIRFMLTKREARDIIASSDAFRANT
jgi:hypothetical protein